MGESLSLLSRIKEEFSCEPVDVRTYSPLTLAFIGDCVFDLIIRTVVVERGNRAANGLHKTKSAIVKAQTQAEMIELLLPELTAEENSVYRRGRNAKSYTTAKNASVGDYRKATGFEALIGYLYLQDDMDRVLYLVKKGLQDKGIEI
ncbi:MAG: ribonuclease III [Lachnospiraceae bacterium]|nr:ribonuclease III [Lachnospiraceae bacterium]